MEGARLVHQEYYQELQRLERDNELRAKVLMNGIRRILASKKQGGLGGIFRKRKKSVEAKGW